MRHLPGPPYRQFALRLMMSGALLIALTGLVFADCDHIAVRVIGTADEQISTCRALDEVLSYFEAGGLTVEPRLTVRFEPSVFVRTRGSPINATGVIPVSGSYEGATHEIRILNAATEGIGRRPWGLRWDAVTAFSVLEHEIVHAVIAQIMGERYEMLPHAWHEALAYAVQIDLMPTRLRDDVLARYQAEEGFANTLQINEIVYGLDPDHFAVAAYQTYKRGHGFVFLKKALQFELEMIDLNDFLP
jgi:uncharacterized protein DUF6639